MKGNYAILKNKVLIKKDVILQDSSVIEKRVRKQQNIDARAINPEPVKKKGIE